MATITDALKSSPMFKRARAISDQATVGGSPDPKPKTTVAASTEPASNHKDVEAVSPAATPGPVATVEKKAPPEADNQEMDAETRELEKLALAKPVASHSRKDSAWSDAGASDPVSPAKEEAQATRRSSFSSMLSTLSEQLSSSNLFSKMVRRNSQLDAPEEEQNNERGSENHESKPVAKDISQGSVVEQEVSAATSSKNPPSAPPAPPVPPPAPVLATTDQGKEVKEKPKISVEPKKAVKAPSTPSRAPQTLDEALHGSPMFRKRRLSLMADEEVAKLGAAEEKPSEEKQAEDKPPGHIRRNSRGISMEEALRGSPFIGLDDEEDAPRKPPSKLPPIMSQEVVDRRLSMSMDGSPVKPSPSEEVWASKSAPSLEKHSTTSSTRADSELIELQEQLRKQREVMRQQMERLDQLQDAGRKSNASKNPAKEEMTSPRRFSENVSLSQLEPVRPEATPQHPQPEWRSEPGVAQIEERKNKTELVDINPNQAALPATKSTFRAQVVDAALQRVDGRANRRVYVVNVECDGMSWVVYRRDKAFRALHNSLARSGLVSKFPSLADRKVVTHGPNAAIADVANRRRELDRFLQGVLGHPDLGNREETLVFLEGPDQSAEWRKTIARLKRQKGVVDSGEVATLTAENNRMSARLEEMRQAREKEQAKFAAIAAELERLKNETRAERRKSQSAIEENANAAGLIEDLEGRLQELVAEKQAAEQSRQKAEGALAEARMSLAQSQGDLTHLQGTVEAQQQDLSEMMVLARRQAEPRYSVGGTRVHFDDDDEYSRRLLATSLANLHMKIKLRQLSPAYRRWVVVANRRKWMRDLVFRSIERSESLMLHGRFRRWVDRVGYRKKARRSILNTVTSWRNRDIRRGFNALKMLVKKEAIDGSRNLQSQVVFPVPIAKKPSEELEKLRLALGHWTGRMDRFRNLEAFMDKANLRRFGGKPVAHRQMASAYWYWFCNAREKKTHRVFYNDLRNGLNSIRDAVFKQGVQLESTTTLLSEAHDRLRKYEGTPHMFSDIDSVRAPSKAALDSIDAFSLRIDDILVRRGKDVRKAERRAAHAEARNSRMNITRESTSPTQRTLPMSPASMKNMPVQRELDSLQSNLAKSTNMRKQNRQTHKLNMALRSPSPASSRNVDSQHSFGNPSLGADHSWMTNGYDRTEHTASTVDIGGRSPSPAPSPTPSPIVHQSSGYHSGAEILEESRSAQTLRSDAPPQGEGSGIYMQGSNWSSYPSANNHRFQLGQQGSSYINSSPQVSTNAMNMRAFLPTNLTKENPMMVAPTSPPSSKMFAPFIHRVDAKLQPETSGFIDSHNRVTPNPAHMQVMLDDNDRWLREQLASLQ